MGKRDVAVVAVVAAVTAAVVAAVFQPGPVAAEDRSEAAKLVKTPTIEAKGVRLTLSPGKTAYGAGEKPALTLRAVNPGAEPVELETMICMMVTSPTPPLARFMPGPRQAWSRKCALSLGASETKDVALETGVGLGAGEQIQFVVRVEKSAATLARFAVPGGANARIVLAPVVLAPEELLAKLEKADAKKPAASK